MLLVGAHGQGQPLVARRLQPGAHAGVQGRAMRGLLGIVVLEPLPQLCLAGLRHRQLPFLEHIRHQVGRRAKHVGHAVGRGQRGMAQLHQGLAGGRDDGVFGVQQRAVHVEDHGAHAGPVHGL